MGKGYSLYSSKGLVRSGFYSLLIFSLLFLAEGLQAKAPGTPNTALCEVLLSRQISDFKEVPLFETSEGRRVYQKIREAMGPRSRSIRQIVEDPKHKSWTQKDLLNYLESDRKALLFELKQLASELPEKSPLRGVLEYTFRHTAASERHEEREQRLIKKYLGEFGNVPLLEVLDFENRSKYVKLVDFTMGYWGKSRSYVAELLTALEVSGFYALGAHIYQLIPEEHLELFVERFRQLGKENLLAYEIDVVAYDQEAQKFHWIEVKHISKTMSRGNKRIKTYIQRKHQLNEFLDIIKSNPDLEALWTSRIEFHWVIRGARVEDDVLKYLRQSHGLSIYWNSAFPINSQFSQ